MISATRIFALIALFALTAVCLAVDGNFIDLSQAKLVKEYDNGSKEYLLPQGTTALIWPSGQTRRVLGDGTVIYTWPAQGEGEIVRIVHPGGDVESEFGNGASKTKRTDGNTIWKFPDGMRREEKPDGSVWETSPAHRDIIDPEIVEMSSWPRFVKAGNRVVFSGTLKEGYSKPWCCVIYPTGVIKEIGTEKFKIDGARFSVPVTLEDGSGIYRVELIATGKYGNRVAVNVSIWADIRPGENDIPVLYPTISPNDSINKIENAFFEMLNRERVKRNIKVVESELELSSLARHMADELRGEKYVGHVSPRWGNIAQRAVKVYEWNRISYGLPPHKKIDDPPNYIADDIIKARSVGGAFATLMESPAHRMTLLAGEWSHAGVGATRIEGGDGRNFVVVIAMAQFNRIKITRKKASPKKKRDDEEDENYFKIYGRPGDIR